MKNYEKPIVMINEDMAEGVYAASGCWTIYTTFGNRVESEGYSNFRVIANHNSTLHISTATTIVIPFDGNVSAPEFDGGAFTASASGNIVTLVRANHANSEGSADGFNSNLKVYCDANTAPIDRDITYTCDKQISVNGGMD